MNVMLQQLELNARQHVKPMKKLVLTNVCVLMMLGHMKLENVPKIVLHILAMPPEIQPKLVNVLQIISKKMENV